MTILNPSKRALMKCTFADIKGGTRKRERRRREEAEFLKVKRALGTGEGEHSLKA